jgi:hypothetical protein
MVMTWKYVVRPVSGFPVVQTLELVKFGIAKPTSLFLEENSLVANPNP